MNLVQRKIEEIRLAGQFAQAALIGLLLSVAFDEPMKRESVWMAFALAVFAFTCQALYVSFSRRYPR